MITFDQLREQSHSRIRRWHPGFPGEEDPLVAWSGGDWGNALAGETGEACNVVKKIRRLETSKRGRVSEEDVSLLVEKLADELADVVIYADCLSQLYGIDLGEAVKDKFNATSIEYGFPERLQ